MQKGTLATVGMLVYLVGCVEGTAPAGDPLTPEDYDELSELMRDLVAGEEGAEVSAMQDTIEVVSGSADAPAQLSDAGTVTVEIGDITYDYDVSCVSAGGSVTDCGPTTEGASASVEWSGSIQTFRWQFDISRTGTWELTGVVDGPVRFDGDGNFAVFSEYSAPALDYYSSWDLTYDAEYDGLRLDLTDLLPFEGSIRYTIAANRVVDGAVRQVDGLWFVDALIEFTGTGLATVTFDGDVTYDLEID